MFITSKTISSPCDFNSKFVRNFVGAIVAMKSTPYIATIDRNINAKSILGLLSADIKKGDDIYIQCVDNYDEQQTKDDLDIILGLLMDSIGDA